MYNGQHAGTAQCLLHLILADLPILAEDRTKTHRMNPKIAGDR